MHLAPFLLAYIGTGITLVAKDFAERPVNRPGYARDRQFKIAGAMVALWMPWTIRMFVMYGSRGGWRGALRYLGNEAGLLYLVFVFLWTLLEA